jgi:hypothetical protein
MVRKVSEKCIEVTKKLVCVLEVIDLCERWWYYGLVMPRRD